MVLGKTPVERLLTKNTDQTINGDVFIHGNVIIRNGSHLNLNHLTTSNPVFDVNLKEILDDSFKFGNTENIYINTNKWFKNLTIGQMTVENDFWQIGSTTSDIIIRLEELSKGINLTGPLTFSNQFKIDDLSVTGAINDISSSQFGNEWFSVEGEQVLQNTFTTSIVHILLEFR